MGEATTKLLCPICLQRHSLREAHVWPKEDVPKKGLDHLPPAPLSEGHRDIPGVPSLAELQQASIDLERSAFDRVAYQREYMRKYRQAKKGGKA